MVRPSRIGQKRQSPLIFVDTTAFYALLNDGDASHDAAANVWAALAQRRDSLHTTNYVVVETMSLLQARLGVRPARAFHDELLPVVQMHTVDSFLHEAAVDLFFSESRRHLSLIDCSSFVFMRRSGIRRAFSFDRDFKHSGFELL